MKNIKDQSSKSNLHSESNELDAMKRLDVFKVPVDYFENLSGEIAQKIHTAPSHESDVVFTFRKYAVAAAITVALIATGTIYFLNNSQNEKTQMAFTYDDLIDSGYAYEYEDQLLFDDYYSNKSASDSIENSMADYLLNGDIDITLIINEL